jgi:hypothetical protein
VIEIGREEIYTDRNPLRGHEGSLSGHLEVLAVLGNVANANNVGTSSNVERVEATTQSGRRGHLLGHAEASLRGAKCNKYM